MMNKSRVLKIIILLIIACSAIVPLNSAYAADKILLRLLASGDIYSSDPTQVYDQNSELVSSLFYVGLVKMKDNTPVPALAESWTISDDGMTYTFTLRDGLKFSNGRDLTTDDVRYSFLRLLDPKNQSPTAFMFMPILGADDFWAGKATDVAGIKIIDKRTIEFKMKAPTWSIMPRFALPAAYIVAKEGVEAVGVSFDWTPLGAGPYRLDKWVDYGTITGIKNPYYYDASKIAFDRFEVRMNIAWPAETVTIANGDADAALDFMINSDYAWVSADPALSKQLLKSTYGPDINFIAMDTSKPPFDKAEVRKALSMAINRVRIAKLFNGRAVPIGGFIPPNLPGANPEVNTVAYDPEGAKKLLASAGYPNGFKVAFFYYFGLDDIKLARAIIPDLQAIGLNVASAEVGSTSDSLKSNPDENGLALTDWNSDYLDPSALYDPLFQCNVPYNTGNYCNADMDALYAKANALPIADARWMAFADLDAKLAEQVPVLFVIHKEQYFILGNRVVIPPDPGLGLDLADATLK